MRLRFAGTSPMAQDIIFLEYHCQELSMDGLYSQAVQCSHTFTKCCTCRMKVKGGRAHCRTLPSLMLSCMLYTCLGSRSKHQADFYHISFLLCSLHVYYLIKGTAHSQECGRRVTAFNHGSNPNPASNHRSSFHTVAELNHSGGC
jgi:hypothetical protein